MRQLSHRARPGFAIVQTMLVLAAMTVLLVASISFTQNAQRAGRKYNYSAQALNVARGGLVDAIAYFKRQSVQPVEAFAPVYNDANPLKGDTNDPAAIDPGGAFGKPHLGMVQEFEIDKTQNLWARFEVGKITKLTKDAQGHYRNYQIREPEADPKLWTGPTQKWRWRDIDDAVSDSYEGVRDLTEQYGLQGKGLLWSIRSHGYVFRKDPKATAATRFYQYPNDVLAQAEMDTEIFRLQVADYGAALNGDDGKKITIANTGGISGGDGYALQWNVNPTTPAVANPQYHTSNIEPFHCRNTASEPLQVLDWFEMFGITDGTVLANLADSRGTDQNALPSSGGMAITYIKPPAGTPVAFHDDRWGAGQRTLSGAGILVVDGDMLIENWSSNTWTGVIYVTGDFIDKSLLNVSGEIVVKGKIDIRPTEVEYNPSVLSTVRQRLAQYRERRAPQTVYSED